MATVSVQKSTFRNRNLRLARRVGVAQYPRLTLRPLVAALAALGLAQPIYAQQLPQGPAVVNGSASIGTNGSQMIITNSPNAILNWQSFSIGAQNGVRFQQENSASQVLNRVTGNDPSQILGSLSSNGRVWLINPNGVLFGQNARINVAGIVASTLDIANADFLAGRYNFVAANGPNRGEVMNKGDIRTTFGGRVWLLGEQVKNAGLVETPGGQIVLAAGKSIELVDSGMPNVIVRVTAPENEAINLGTLVATGGSVDLHAGIVNQSGIVRATGVTSDANGRISLKAMTDVMLADGSKTQASSVNVVAGNTLNNRGEVSGTDISLSGNQVLQQGLVKAPGGNITLTAQTGTYLDGSVDVSNSEGKGGNIRLTTGKLEGMAGGSLNADGQQGGQVYVEGRGMIAFSSTLSAVGKDQGGAIEVTGNNVYLLNADVNASGGNQGGTVHLGGGWQGSGDLLHANEVMVGLGSEVKANGAKGGEIAVWSTKSSEHYGSLQTKGGGRIELSSKGVIRQTGDLQTGPGGSVLFDPKNLIIIDTPPDNLALARTVVSGSVRSSNGESSLSLTNDDGFGTSVSLNGDRLAIGAVGDDTMGLETGAVHLFTGVGADFSGLTWQKTLASKTGAVGMPELITNGSFGFSVALDGDHLVVGAPASGAGVHLFTGVGTDFSGLTWRGSIGAKIPQLSGAFFGHSVALDGNRLAVGAPLAAGGGTARGAVHLFNGVGSDFSGLTLRRSISSSTVPLSDQDNFGFSVALDGDRLAIGAPSDNTRGLHRGAVYLFKGVGTDYSGLALSNKLFSGNGVVNMPELQDSDLLGYSIGLDGDRLVVGAVGDDPPGLDRSGAVHLFTGVGTDFTGLTWRSKIAAGSGATGMTPLRDVVLFGHSVALDGDRLAVGVRGGINASNPEIDPQSVYLFTGLSGLGSTPIGVSDATFNFDPSGTSYITPASIVALLGQGSSVTLQANNDISVLSPVIVGNDVFGDFTLRAGRDITFGANVAPSLGGNLTAIAGDPGANPAFRDPGTPTIRINKGVTLGVQNSTATLAAIGGNVINLNGDAAIDAGFECCGRWLIYSADPATSIEGFTSFDKHYNQGFTPGIIPAYASTGNWFLYSLAPTLSVTPNSRSISYGATTPSFTPSLNGFIDGDTSATAGLSGAAAWNVGGTVSSSGNATVGAHNVGYSVGLLSNLGYQFSDNIASNNELTVDAKALTASAITALDKIYDGTTAATLSGGTLSGGIIAGDVVSLTGATGNFDNKNVGNVKTVSITGGALTGTDAANYSVSIGATTTADITPLSLTASYVGNNKVYDGTVVASVNAGSANIVAGDVVNFSQTANFIDKNAGVGKSINISGIALSGPDASNYALSNSSAATSADITIKDVTASGFLVADKVYDGTSVASISGGALLGIIVGDAVNISGATGTFDNKNVGAEKPVAVSSVSIAGADSRNYTVAPAGAVAADVTPATLVFVADPVVGAAVPPSGLTGVVVGFKVGDSLANATTGTPIWTTPATPGSPRGTYGVEGGGLTAGNYVFVQAPSNSTALTLFTLNKPDLPEQQASNDAINSINSMVKSIYSSQTGGDTSGKFLALSLAAPGNRVSDLSASPGFGSIDLSSMSRDQMTQLIDLRREFKKKLFADAIYKLEVDPSLAEVPECANAAAADSGLCRLSDTQRQEAVAKLAQANAVSSSRKVKEATLPEIRRKIVIAFGINSYADQEIQPLDNAVLDAKAVSKAFAKSLGYEVRIVENPTKADIIRTLNQLSTEIQKNDSVVVYYAGHGFKLDETGLGYWIPSDGSADDPKNWISNTDVSKMLASIGANQVAVISDSCYSGAFTKEKKVEFATKEVKPDEILTKRSVVVMSSGGDEPVVDSGGKGGHSIFAAQLMETIQSVDKWQAGNNIFEAVQAAVHKKFPQQPQYGAAVSAGHQVGGDYLFEFRQLEPK